MEKSILDKLYEEYKIGIMNDDTYLKLTENTSIILNKISQVLPADKKDLIRQLNEAISEMTDYGNNKNFNQAFRLAIQFNNDINSNKL